MNSGVLVVAKPTGVTSFDVVALVRRVLRVRRVGHAGTLDPEGSGVLPVLIGEATKLMPYLVDQDKEYRVSVRFGVTTDTLDASGRVLSTSPVPGLDRPTLERITERFLGTIRQVPPMYSAVHHRGRRLYELARQGVEVEREAREVVVYQISVEDVDEATATLRVVCGKGTYVRVLAADVGAMLGVGAVVDGLERTRVGPFDLERAVSWDDLGSGRPETLWAQVLPAEAAISRWPAVRLGVDAARGFLHGQAVTAVGGGGRETGLVRVHGMHGVLLGVGELTAAGTLVRPIRVLHVDHQGAGVISA